MAIVKEIKKGKTGTRGDFMRLKYLLDTNILSEPKRPQPNLGVREKLQSLKREVATATLVIHELLFDYFRVPASKKCQDLEDYLENVVLAHIPVFEYNVQASRWHAGERARLTKIGKTPALVDGQIASISFVVDDFSDWQGVVVENLLF